MTAKNLAARKPRDSAKLTDKEARFVEEYLVDLCAAGAATRAGYSPRTAKEIGYELLHRPRVADAIKKRQAVLRKKIGIDQERVLGELARIGFANILDYIRVDGDGLARVDLSELSRDTGAAVASVEVDTRREAGDSEDIIEKVKFKLHDKISALDKIARHLGMFVEKHEHTGKDGEPLQLGDTELARQIAFLLRQGVDAG